MAMTSFYAEKCYCHLVSEHEASAQYICSNMQQFLIHTTFVLLLFVHMQSLKTYQLYHGEWQQAEAKLRHAEHQKMKLDRQQSAGSSGVTAAKSVLSRRFRNFEKLSEKV